MAGRIKVHGWTGALLGPLPQKGAAPRAVPRYYPLCIGSYVPVRVGDTASPLPTNGRYGQSGQHTIGHSRIRIRCQCMQSKHLAAIAAFGSRPDIALSYFF
jgi:hypothetical protein